MSERLALRVVLAAVALVWLGAEWAIALPPLIRVGFGPWHRTALGRLRHDPAFQLVALDYLLCYLVAFGVSVREARRASPRRWPVWAAAFLLFTAPALLLFWATRSLPPPPRQR